MSNSSSADADTNLIDNLFDCYGEINPEIPLTEIFNYVLTYVSEEVLLNFAEKHRNTIKFDSDLLQMYYNTLLNNKGIKNE